MTVVFSMGRWCLFQVESFVNIWLTAYLSVRAMFRQRTSGLKPIMEVVASQIYFSGVQSFPLVVSLALLSGVALVLHASWNVQLFGSREFLGQIFVTVVVREVGPILTALVMIARSGTAVAIEIGNMKVNQEVQALELMGIQPLSYLIFPRLVGGVIGFVCLAVYFILGSFLGGLLTSLWTSEAHFNFLLDAFFEAISKYDVGFFLVKTVVSGVLIFVTSCQAGMSVQRSSTEVPIVATQAVVRSIVLISFFHFFASLLFYAIHFGKGAGA